MPDPMSLEDAKMPEQEQVEEQPIPQEEPQEGLMARRM